MGSLRKLGSGRRQVRTERKEHDDKRLFEWSPSGSVLDAASFFCWLVI